jgi:hypothetical protein
MNDNLIKNSRIWIFWAWKICLSNLNHKWCIGGKVLDFNYKNNLTFKNTFAFLSFTGSICTFKYNHFIEPRIEGHKVASHSISVLTLFLLRVVPQFFNAPLKLHKFWLYVDDMNRCISDKKHKYALDRSAILEIWHVKFETNLTQDEIKFLEEVGFVLNK